MLASDADRDTAGSLLNEAFAEGRLTADEHDQRLSAAYTARTWQQLRELTADLPAQAVAAKPMPPAMFAGLDPCLLCVLLIVCPPAGLAWWLLSRRRAGTDPDAQLTPGRPAMAAASQPVRPSRTADGGDVAL
jgi:hypothetical protein